VTDKLSDGQNSTHYTLPQEELDKDFVRPVRSSYKHLVCGTVTTMGIKIAQTYARKPDQYTTTWCMSCKAYLPVGADGEFVWDEPGEPKVGT
jgi:hypothetical protein